MSIRPGADFSYDPAFFDSFHQVPAYRLRYPDENVIRFLVGNFPSTEREHCKVLDLGCGCGRHLVLLGELGFQPYGIDGSSWAVNYAREWLHERGVAADVRHGSITRLPYQDGIFDGIVEHATLVNNGWTDILKACQECHRVLRDGGVGFFLLKTPRDCAFDDAEEVGHNTFVVDEDVYMSRSARDGQIRQTFRAFDRDDISKMFAQFSAVRVHTWETSFKGLEIEAIPGERLTSYWIVVVRK